MRDAYADDHGFRYFQTVFSKSLDLIEAFPITSEPALMGYVTGVLEPVAAAQRAESPFTIPDAAMIEDKRRWLVTAGGEEQRRVGLNTIGLLLDRLSILAIKHWNLIHRRKSPNEARSLVETQVTELIWALSRAYPGQSSLNNKMTARSVCTQSADFAQAYCGLATTNILLWEAQEMLYNHDISALEAKELRAYIDFFSRGNLERNAYIHSSDACFWSIMTEDAALP